MRIVDNKVIIIMYHYVRDLSYSRYPNLKGLDYKLFSQQIDYLSENFNIISTDELLEAIEKKVELPLNSILLTFDDGYIDHYTNVFPILKEKKISGLFSVPAKIIEEGKLLDVNKIHFILESVNISKLLDVIFGKLNKYRNAYNILPNDLLYNNLIGQESLARYDNKDVVFVKRLFQYELEGNLKDILLNELFNEIVSVPEEIIAKELYMNYKQMQFMKREGMFFGIHGYSHFWLNKLSDNEMIEDISKSLSIFSDIVDLDNWIMCYPYGSYNENIINYISNKGCKLGLSTQLGVANIFKDNILTLPRLDTNDFPPKSKNYLNFCII